MRGIILAAALVLALAACATNDGPVPKSAEDLRGRHSVETRTATVQWDGVGSFRGDVAFENAYEGGIFVELPGKEASCGGRFAAQGSGAGGRWSLTCSNGLAANGSYKPLGEGRGAEGDGRDNQGRKVRFAVSGR